MHIPDGYLSLEVSVLMSVVSVAFLVLCWRKVKAAYPKSFASLLAVSSAFVFVAQMINFPITYGTSGHLVGGTFLSVVLGPYAAVISMTIVLLIQALFFADGGISALGANIFNMAIISGLSFFLAKLIAGNNIRGKRFVMGVFAASWLSVVLGALACGLEIGVSPAFSQAGGVAVTVPTMLFWHALIGFGEAIITTTFITQLSKLQAVVLNGLTFFRRDAV
ncbi:MAG: energy-coupling factor ABC transporter permease [Candidatus Bathyarchaeia archaeon]|nr:energy-coupling factor ABC transporter permease [Candidatus Bathyarchaeota archaeon]